MPETRTLGQVLESVRALLEAKRVKCPGCGLQCDCVPGTEYHCTNHYKCGGTGQILNPAYAPLLALVREACPGIHRNSNSWTLGSLYFCVPCKDTFYVTRTAYWAAAPNGALEGALRKELLKDIWRRLPATQGPAELLETISNLMEEPGDTRIQTLEELEKWLKGEA